MSELKVYRDPKTGPCWREFYEKSEADKVITELEEKITRLENIRRVLIEAVTSMEAGLQQEAISIRHADYKRCLAMAMACTNGRDYSDSICYRKAIRFYARWEKIWLELAEVFK